MKISCNRCKKELDSPDKRNAYYINELTLENRIMVRKNIIICKKCKKEKDDVIW
jgi:hypothetical protein